MDTFPLLLDIVDVALHSNKLFPRRLAEFFMFRAVGEGLGDSKAASGLYDGEKQTRRP